MEDHEKPKEPKKDLILRRGDFKNDATYDAILHKLGVPSDKLDFVNDVTVYYYFWA